MRHPGPILQPADSTTAQVTIDAVAVCSLAAHSSHQHLRRHVQDEAAFLVQCIVAFALSFVATIVGTLNLPLDPWLRTFLAISVLFLVSSPFGLAEVVRDHQEAATVRVRLDGAASKPYRRSTNRRNNAADWRRTRNGAFRAGLAGSERPATSNTRRHSSRPSGPVTSWLWFTSKG